MATITFKGKIQTVYNMDNTIAWEYVRVPMFKRQHCNMHDFRQHPKYGGLANSDLFPAVLQAIRKTIIDNTGDLRLDKAPANVTVDTSGFLATVIITV